MEFGSVRRIALWGVILTTIADLTVSSFWIMYSLSISFGASSGGAFDSSLMSLIAPLSSAANIAFAICLAVYLYAVHRDLNELNRSLEYTQHGIVLSASGQPVIPQ